MGINQESTLNDMIFIEAYRLFSGAQKYYLIIYFHVFSQVSRA